METGKLGKKNVLYIQVSFWYFAGQIVIVIVIIVIAANLHQ